MKKLKIWILFSFLLCTVLCEQFTQYPQGYYPFEESPAKIPPKVRKPPYLQTQVNCPGINGNGNEQTLDNLCGDLNKGYLPLNPTGQLIEGVTYPFDLIKKKTLEFFSKTLPILKSDDTLPKVAKYAEGPSQAAYSPQQHKINFYHHRTKRSVESVSNPSPGVEEESKESQPNGPPTLTPRQGRGWCDDSYGVFCMLFNAFKGNAEKSGDRDDDVPSLSSLNSLEAPMTPCPSAVEYVTPVFAKNYQGVWRYVVQIPYEGYFTQTVEVVKCLSTKCAYLDGSCLASPRWVSLLVAEIYYPDATFPDPNVHPQGRQPIKGVNPPTDYNKLFSKRSGTSEGVKCDGTDELGCYQVRLYYDWFLIPGSCKCWKNDFFEQYAKKK